ncbi:MAG: YkuS family protein [Clostridia bacterium]|nr:YkuS family protein [Clostridia bacterium]
MNVLYEDGLEDVAVHLSAMGYTMRRMREGIPADAVIYTDDAHSALGASAAGKGAALICVRGMSAGEISRLLSRRGCAPLF